MAYVYNSSIPFSFTFDGASNYSATFGSQSWTGTLASGLIDGIAVFDDAENTGDGGNVFFNNLSVSEVPEPATCAGAVLAAVGCLVLSRRK